MVRSWGAHLARYLSLGAWRKLRAGQRRAVSRATGLLGSTRPGQSVSRAQWRIICQPPNDAWPQFEAARGQLLSQALFRRGASRFRSRGRIFAWDIDPVVALVVVLVWVARVDFVRACVGSRGSNRSLTRGASPRQRQRRGRGQRRWQGRGQSGQRLIRSPGGHAGDAR